MKKSCTLLLVCAVLLWMHTSLLAGQPEEPRVWLGIVVKNVDQKLARVLHLKTPKGVFVAFTVPFGPADQQGIRIADIIKAVDGEQVTDIMDLKELLRRKDPGDPASLHIVRNGSQQELSLTLPEVNTKAKEGVKPTSGQEVL